MVQLLLKNVFLTTIIFYAVSCSAVPESSFNYTNDLNKREEYWINGVLLEQIGPPICSPFSYCYYRTTIPGILLVNNQTYLWEINPNQTAEMHFPGFQANQTKESLDDDWVPNVQVGLVDFTQLGRIGMGIQGVINFLYYNFVRPLLEFGYLMLYIHFYRAP